MKKLNFKDLKNSIYCSFVNTAEGFNNDLYIRWYLVWSFRCDTVDASLRVLYNSYTTKSADYKYDVIGRLNKKTIGATIRRPWKSFLLLVKLILIQFAGFGVRNSKFSRYNPI